MFAVHKDHLICKLYQVNDINRLAYYFQKSIKLSKTQWDRSYVMDLHKCTISTDHNKVTISCPEMTIVNGWLDDILPNRYIYYSQGQPKYVNYPGQPGYVNYPELHGATLAIWMNGRWLIAPSNKQLYQIRTAAEVPQHISSRMFIIGLLTLLNQLDMTQYNFTESSLVSCDRVLKDDPHDCKLLSLNIHLQPIIPIQLIHIVLEFV